MTNHYRTLGVDPQADAVVIRSAYLALIRRYHPDRGGSEADPERAQAITAAWEVLRDPERRAAYDEGRQARFQPGGVAAYAMGPRVRGGAWGRNLFLLLAGGTIALGWWASQQPLGNFSSSEVGAATRSAPLGGSAAGPGAKEDQEPIEVAPQAAAPDFPDEPEVSAPIDVPLPESAPPSVAERGVTARMSERPSAASQPIAREEKVAGAPAKLPAPRIAAPAVDLAPLERHLQLFTDQSLRFGTEAKRTRLLATRDPFLRRLGDCADDACRRDTYLRRNQEVAEIMRN